MPFLAEEENKDAAEAPGRIGEVVGDENDIDSDEEEEEEELVDLPPEVAKALGERVFESEEELVQALETAGFGDLPVLLVNGNPRLKMPSDQRNSFTTRYAIHFNYYCMSGKMGRWGCCSGTHKIHLPHGRSRDPDLSYWGYPRCNDGLLSPADRGSIPDVIIQLSLKNKRGYEEDAIDDMMNNGLEHDHGPPSMTRPTVGYLIKVKFSKKRTLAGAIKGSKTRDLVGLRIFRLKHGTTVNDAEGGNSPDAEAWDYIPGGPERFIVVSPQDLGITGMWALLFGEYKIKMSEVFQDMNEYHKRRQSKGLAT